MRFPPDNGLSWLGAREKWGRARRPAQADQGLFCAAWAGMVQSLERIGGGRRCCCSRALRQRCQQGLCPWPARGCGRAAVMGLPVRVGLPPGRRLCRREGRALPSALSGRSDQRRAAAAHAAAAAGPRLKCVSRGQHFRNGNQSHHRDGVRPTGLGRSRARGNQRARAQDQQSLQAAGSDRPSKDHKQANPPPRMLLSKRSRRRLLAEQANQSKVAAASRTNVSRGALGNVEGARRSG